MIGLFLDKERSWREKFWWAIHNLIAHPASELLYWFGLENLGNKLHDWTAPSHNRNIGRG